MGKIPDASHLKPLIDMLLALDVYKTEFERMFIEETDGFYKYDSSQKIQTLSLKEYLDYITQSIDNESNRLIRYLDSNTTNILFNSVKNKIILDQLKLIFTKGFNNLLQERDVSYCKLLYQHIQCIDEITFLKSHFVEYIKISGAAVLEKTEKPETIMKNIVNLYHDTSIIVKDAFEANQDFVYAQKQAFENFLNVHPNEPAEYLAKYLDQYLNKSMVKVVKKSSSMEGMDEEVEQIVENVMPIFGLLQAKDIFEAFYSKRLAKRLLLRKSVSYDLELFILKKIKEECGNLFTKKCEEMFKDIEISSQTMNEYNSHTQSPSTLSKEDKIEFNCHILTQGYWPSEGIIAVSLPNEILALQNRFQTYYLNKNSGRVLQWHIGMSYCEIRAQFIPTSKTIQLLLSGFQGLTLLNFNEKESYSYKELQDLTSINDEDLEKTLASLSCMKHIILIKTGNPKRVTKEDVFTINKEFASKLKKLTINQIQKKETKEENMRTVDRVLEDRRFVIDAAIVKIMKGTKTESHTNLCSKLFQVLRFPIKTSDIKLRIESLIEKDYLKRDDKNSSTYHYLA